MALGGEGAKAETFHGGELADPEGVDGGEIGGHQKLTQRHGGTETNKTSEGTSLGITVTN
jgi:hypothetical protein